MTATPPPYQPPPPIVFVPPPRRTSGAAVTSLVMGLLGLFGGWCLCGVPCILAVVFGHIGAARTRSGEVAGHGMAVAGLVLGYIFVLPAIAFSVLVLMSPADAADLVRGLGDFFTGLFG